MSDLAIIRIDVFQVQLPYAHGVYHLSAGREYASFDSTIVRITTNNGLEGWGESTPFGATYINSHALGVRAGIAEIAPHLIGLDPRRVDRINDAMDAALLGHEHAKTAIDVACWDVFGKSVGLPVCELLGGRTDVKLSMMSSIGVCSPAEMRSKVAEYRAKGYKGHSIKIGGDPKADASSIVAALADKEDDEFFLADANTGLTVEMALRMLQLLPHGLDFVLESPCATWREHLALRRRTNVPMIIDELATDAASIVQLIADDAAEGVNLKISKAGGLTRARRQRDILLAAGLTIGVQDTVGSDVSFAAIMHLSQTIPARNFRCMLNTQDMVTLQTADLGYTIENGLITAPSAPGLGLNLRLDVLGEPVASYP
ncbi:mandelate racemase muconate lactonizing protein [Stagonosporopsis vannaccii]|nr:mandelate racemase muconate lactonizing protein [Stagonosporopsis vannaccii]